MLHAPEAVRARAARARAGGNPGLFSPRATKARSVPGANLKVARGADGI
ncbi:MAG: hypothetical protein LBI10_04155 [Deltaproteobacteria bacterium]|nr:hypothetical protein [Deltaproteobacteria bacterium]